MARDEFDSLLREVEKLGGEQLTGHARKDWEIKQLERMGAMPKKALKMPLRHLTNHRKKESARHKMVEEAAQHGVLAPLAMEKDSIHRAKMRKEEKRLATLKAGADKGIEPLVGRMRRDGRLILTKKDISYVRRQGQPKRQQHQMRRKRPRAAASAKRGGGKGNSKNARRRTR
jgi:Domain of unknown function (DUF4602)